jgi:hypothetical protein
VAAPRQRRHAHHELKRVDPVRHQPSRAVLIVARRRDAHLSWQLDATHALDDRAERQRSFGRTGQLAGFLFSVAILDRNGRDITPKVRWTSSERAPVGHSPAVDDRTPPVPYLIDPIALTSRARSQPLAAQAVLPPSTGSSSRHHETSARSAATLVAQLTVRSTGVDLPPAG